ncbi:MAG TPA: histidine--tRNA ligase [Bacillota bacterium]|nr:histidine--tRNA ligase [Bacillota bacterium]HPL53998.1 histidine--tRNA ligase [Bacillota bacterium]
MLTQAPKGTKDILPSEVYKWHYVENIIREICALHGYREIRTPIFEHTELFERGVGETTDVVQKEMYTFMDKGERSITLKPEGTSPTVRAFVEHSIFNEPQPTKAYYLIPCFRYEKPQSGRLREHHQFGVEALGTSDPSVDAEIINIAMMLYGRLGVEDLEIRINSVGCPKCRAEYNKKLKEYLSKRLDNLCETCRERYEKNPMRIIDCKEEKCKQQLSDIPYMLDNTCNECREHFEGLKNSLEALGLAYVVDPRIVRGLDYYTKTAFEIVSNDIGAQGTVCGGGRYDGLVKECGGPDTPGIGFGLGLERLLLVVGNRGIDIPVPVYMDVYIANIGDKGSKEALRQINKLRKEGIKAEKDYMGRSLRSQMKYANKINAGYVVVLGDEEIKSGRIKVKDMGTGNEEEINLEDLADYIKGRMKDKNTEGDKYGRNK